MMLNEKTCVGGVVSRNGFEAHLHVLEKSRADEICRIATYALGESRWYRIEIEPHQNQGFIVRGIPAINRYSRAEEVLDELKMSAAILGLKSDDWRTD